MVILERQLWLLPRPCAGIQAASGGHRQPAAACGQAPVVTTALRHAAAAWSTLLVTLPVQFDESSAAEVKADLLAAAERRPHVLIADMSRTLRCDWAGAEALAGTFGRAAAGGTELRLVLADESVRRVISLNGLDQLIAVYGDVAAARATPPGG
jgi:anti-anti-sigma factor